MAKKKILNRDKAETDTRSGGIKSSSHPTRALGDINGRQHVSAGMSKNATLWANVAPVLGKMVSFQEKLADRKYAEEQKMEQRAYSEQQKTEQRSYIEQKQAEAKAEREAEKAMAKAERLNEQMQQLKGLQEGVRLNRELKEGIITGELADHNAVDSFIKERLSEYNEVADPTFVNALYGKAISGQEFAGEELSKKTQAQIYNVGRQALNSATSQIFRGIESYEGFDSFNEDLDLAIQTGVTAGLPEHVAVQGAFQSGLSEMSSAYLESDNPLAAQDIAEKLLSHDKLLFQIPLDNSGRSGREQVLFKLESILTKKEIRDKNKASEELAERNRLWGENAITMRSQITQASSSPEQLEEMRIQHEGMSAEELRDNYGSLGPDIRKAIDTAQRYALGYISPLQEESFNKLAREMAQNRESALIWNDQYFFEATAELTPPQVEILESQRKEFKNAEMMNFSNFINNSTISLHNWFNDPDFDKDNRVGRRLAYPRLKMFDDEGGVTWAAQVYEQKLRDGLLENIDASDQKYKDNRTQLAKDIFSFVHDFENKVKAGQTDWLVDAANVTAIDPKDSVRRNPLFYTSQEIDQDPVKLKEVLTRSH